MPPRVGDVSKPRELLGFSAGITLRDGLQTVLDELRAAEAAGVGGAWRSSSPGAAASSAVVVLGWRRVARWSRCTARMPQRRRRRALGSPGPRRAAVEELPERIDAVIHLAQSRRYREFPEGAVDVQEVNVTPPCGCSTTAAAPAGSRSRTPPRAPYTPPGRSRCARPTAATWQLLRGSKLAGELAVEQFRGMLRAHALRFFFIYGPGQSNMFIPGLLGRVRDGQEVTLAGTDGIRVNPVYVEDAAARSSRRSSWRTRRRSTSRAPTSSPCARSPRSAAGCSDASRASQRHAQADLVASIARQSAALGAPGVCFEEGLRRTVEVGE